MEDQDYSILVDGSLSSFSMCLLLSDNLSIFLSFGLKRKDLVAPRIKLLFLLYAHALLSVISFLLCVGCYIFWFEGFQKLFFRVFLALSGFCFSVEFSSLKRFFISCCCSLYKTGF